MPIYIDRGISHLEKEVVVIQGQYNFIKNRSCQPDFISSFDRITKLVDENTWDLVYLDFSKALVKYLMILLQEHEKV